MKEKESEMTIKGKRTPGPWRVECSVDRGDDLKGTDKYFYICSGTRTAHENRGHFHPEESTYYTHERKVVELSYDQDYSYPDGGIRNEADAHLIAAAPELLEALQKVCAAAESWHRETGHEDDKPMIKCDAICECIPQMQAAIRNATFCDPGDLGGQG